MVWKIPVAPNCIYYVLKYSENSCPAKLPPSCTAGVCYSKVFLSLPSPERQLFALTCLCRMSQRACFLKQVLAFPLLVQPQGRFPHKLLWLMHTRSASSPKIAPFDFQTNNRKRMEQVVHLPEEQRELTWFPSDTAITGKERIQVRLAEPSQALYSCIANSTTFQLREKWGYSFLSAEHLTTHLKGISLQLFLLSWFPMRWNWLFTIFLDKARNTN